MGLPITVNGMKDLTDTTKKMLSELEAMRKDIAEVVFLLREILSALRDPKGRG